MSSSRSVATGSSGSASSDQSSHEIVVVLHVGVVVAALGAPHLVAGHEHRRPGREQQRGQQVAGLPPPQPDDRVGCGVPLDAAVGRAVVVGAVPVVLPVGLVVLVVVGDEVAQREAVVRGDEVDGRDRQPPVLGVEVRRARQPRRQVADAVAAVGPERADGVAVHAVPLRPERRELTDLVPAGADVPRLGDELHLRDDRVLVDDVEERRELVDVVQRAGERGGEIEPEAVDVHLGDPVAQRVGDQLQRERAAGVERVAAAGVVDVAARVVLGEAVVGAVVDAAEREQRAVRAALGGVVVDDVEDHLQARRVQGTDHRLELADRVARVAGAGGVPGVRGEEAEGVVAPEVPKAAALQVRLGDEVVDRQQLDRGDAERGQVLQDRRVREAGVGAAQVLGHVGVLHREPAQVQFVDDGVVPRRVRAVVVTPRERVVHDHRARDVRGRVGVGVRIDRRVLPEVALDTARVRVDQQLLRVVEQAVPGVIRAVDAEAVPLPRPDPGDVAVPHLEGAFGQRDAGLGAVGVEQADGHRGGSGRPQREVGPLAVPGGAERERSTWPGPLEVRCLRAGRMVRQHRRDDSGWWRPSRRRFILRFFLAGTQ